ncbi:MAG: hypothetical protein JNJ57_19870, partial [Saprospiraceae bacterium]|nr:hypothetical protein [Saprospiraceae bacterium]
MKNTIASLGLVLTALLVSLALHAQQPQILLTSKPSEPDSRAAQVLQFYLQKMTGKPVAISPRTPHRSAPSVYIGYSPAAANAGFEKPGALGADDFFMQGKSNAFLIAASGDMGSEYGVYTLLEMLGCRKYSPTDSLIPTVERIQLPELPARIEKPAFPYRELWYVPAFDDAWARWHKLKTHTAKNREWGLFVHTFDRLCAPDKYFAEHPEYFAFNGA